MPDGWRSNTQSWGPGENTFTGRLQVNQIRVKRALNPCANRIRLHQAKRKKSIVVKIRHQCLAWNGTNSDIKPTVTQKLLLSLVSSVYDPFGLVAPYTVKARLLLKDIWRMSGQQWDDDLPPDIVTKFLDSSKELPRLGAIAIARAYLQRKVEALQLHLFGDSSQYVFSAVVILRA